MTGDAETPLLQGWPLTSRMTRTPRGADCIVKTIRRAGLSERRVCFTASSKRVLHFPLYVCVSISYSSHKLCGATAQRVRFGILEIFFFFGGGWVRGGGWGGLISFVPQGLSGMGWLHTTNVHALHARDHSRLSSIPVMKEKKRNMGGVKKRTETFTFSLQVCRRRCEHLWVLTACACLRVCLHTCQPYKLVYL